MHGDPVHRKRGENGVEQDEVTRRSKKLGLPARQASGKAVEQRLEINFPKLAQAEGQA